MGIDQTDAAAGSTTAAIRREMAPSGTVLEVRHEAARGLAVDSRDAQEPGSIPLTVRNRK